MRNRAATLKAKHAGNLKDEPPRWIDESSWHIFTEYVRKGRPLREISRETGLSASRIGLILNLVDQALDPPLPGDFRRDLMPDSPIEELMLSTRSRNALHELRCETIGSVLHADFSKVTTRLRLGRVTRWDIATALARAGFDPPPSLLPLDPRAEALATELRKLRYRLDDDHRFWRQQLQNIEQRVRGLSKAGVISLPDSMEPQ